MKMPKLKTFIKYGAALTAAAVTGVGMYSHYSDENMNEQWQRVPELHSEFKKSPTDYEANQLIDNTDPPGTTAEQNVIVGLIGIAAGGATFWALSKLKM